MKTPFCIYNDRAYKVILPQVDSEQLAQKGDRLMLLHKHHAAPRFEIARQRIIHHGIAIGLFEN